MDINKFFKREYEKKLNQSYKATGYNPTTIEDYLPEDYLPIPSWKKNKK